MKNVIKIFAVVVFLLFNNNILFSQLWPSEGVNMPGTWDGPWTNPPTINALAGIQKVGGKIHLDTSLLVWRYRTLIYVNSSGGDIAGGTYYWKFSSGPTTNYWQNSWGDVTVSMNVLQNYTIGTLNNNTITVSDGKYYTVNFKDNNYTNTDAIWMETSALPCSILTVTQSPLPGSVTSADSVTVTITLNTSKSTEENIYVRYTTDNWFSSSLREVSCVGTTGTAKIPPQIGGTPVSYYVFSTTLSNPTSDFDMVTINHNNNNGLNYYYSVYAAQYTINASAGSHGTITPSGSVLVTHGNNQSFVFTPDPGYSVDSVIVDGVRNWDSTTGYTFYNVALNHTIRVTFARKVNVTFQVNMKVQLKNGNFQPNSGDIVTVRGDFNGWGNTTGNRDTLKDLDGDSIYVKTMSIPEYQVYEYKFWKTERNGLGYESFFPNRNVSIEGTDTTLSAVFFNNETPLYNVTFSVNMKIQMLKGKFIPDSGDVVTVRGSFNDWGNSTNNPDTLYDIDNDSVYTKVIALSGDRYYEYKFWKSFRGGIDYEGNILNRSLMLSLNDTTLATPFFNNDNSFVTQIPIQGRWNMISIPRVVENGLKLELFPTAISNAFYYNGSNYQKADTLRPGIGYWLKFSKDTTISIIGDPILNDSIEVSTGWNLIGSITNTVLINSITSDPPDIITGKFFTYDGGYIMSDSLEPGKAYWVKVSQSGKLYLSSSGNLPKGNSSVSEMSGLDRIIIKDAENHSQTLFIIYQSNKVEKIHRELPPIGPDGFDVRYSSNSFIEFVDNDKVMDIPIIVKNAKYPLTISWDVKSISSNAALQINGKSVLLKNTGAVNVNKLDGDIHLTTSGTRNLPREFLLEQNFPNPFNPSTVIRYQLPEDARVKLVVFNTLGQEVKTLINEYQPAGYKTVQFDANDLPSGVYMYRLEAGAYRAVKKFMLIR